MRTTLCLCAALALVSAASADVRLLVTMADGTQGEWGLDLNGSGGWPDNHMIVTGGEGYDWCGVDGMGGPITIDELNPGLYPGRYGTIPPRDFDSSGIVEVDCTKCEWAYIWFQWNRRADAGYVADVMGAKLTALVVSVTPLGGASFDSVRTSYYPCLNSNCTGTKRWDGTGTPPNYPEWRQNPQTMIAILADGIINEVDTEGWNLYMGKRPGETSSPSTQTRMALLAAVECTGASGVHEFTVEITDINYDAGQAGELHAAHVRFICTLLGDVNCDSTVDFNDINPFVLALTNPDAYEQMFPDCPLSNRDINGDGILDFNDINPFVTLLSSPG